MPLPELTGIIGFVLMVLAILLGVPVGMAMGVTGVAGMMVLKGFGTGSFMFKAIPYNSVASWDISVIPMFVFMGMLLHHSGLSSGIFNVARAWLGWLPAGLAVTVTVACGIMGATTGSSTAMVATVGKLAIPEMRKLGYSKSLSTSVVCCAGAFGQMIPPSMLLVIYAIYAQVSVSRQLLAGFIPGLLEVVAFSITILLWVKIRPSAVPRGAAIKVDWSERFRTIKASWFLPLILLVVFGGLYTGFASPTEIGAFAAFATIPLAFMGGQFSLGKFGTAVSETISATSAMLLLYVGALLFSRFISASGLPFMLGDWLASLDLSRVGFLIILVLVYLIMGMFLESLSMLVLTFPLIYPALTAYNIDLTWFGIFMVLVMEIGMVTPPVGLLVYVAKSVLGDDLDIGAAFRGQVWFTLANLSVVALIIAFPSIVLFLPNVAYG